MTITLKLEKSTKQYEKYTSSDHSCIVSMYIPKEEFHGGKPPRELSCEIPALEAIAKRAGAD